MLGAERLPEPVHRGNGRGGWLRRWWHKRPPETQEKHALDTFAMHTKQEAKQVSDQETKQASRLKFAHAHQRILPEDLPQDYEPDEVYRGLDEYVAARRSVRRKEQRMNRRSASHDSDSDSSHSSSSDSSSGPQVISRIRALFGDSSDSSSDSESDNDESDAESSSRSSSARDSHDTDVSDRLSTTSGRSRRDTSIINTPNMSSAFSPWTPRLSALTSTRRKRRHKRRQQRQERPAHIVKASRMARRNARRLRELSGGVTEYTLFSPTGDARSNTVYSHSWAQIWERMEEYFQYHRQTDGHAGDLGIPGVSEIPSERMQRLNDEDFLKLPSPALNLDNTESKPTQADDHAEISFEQERLTGRHMSDVPLTPYFRSNISGEVAPSPMPFASLSTKLKPQMKSDPVSPLPGSNLPNPSTIDTIPEEPAELYLPEAALDIYGQPHNVQPNVTPPDVAIMKHSLQSDPWWLDIRCPTYKDMQQLSQHFPLHPLTVEDILKQEPREKVETFERLGYYFVVIRALDENHFRFTRPSTKRKDDKSTQDTMLLSPGLVEAQVPKTPRARNIAPKQTSEEGRVHIETVKSESGKEGLEGLTAGSVSLYLVVFSHGVLSFHFEDLRNHTERIRDKLDSAYTDMQHNADWIVHSLYDSIVDAFSPYVTFLQSEVEYVEFLSNDLDITPFQDEKRSLSTKIRRFFTEPLFSTPDDKRTALIAEDLLRSLPEGSKEYVEYLVRRSKKRKAFSTYDALHQSHFILRLTRVREVVMGLTRLLLPKADVVRTLRKRLFDSKNFVRESNMLELYFDDIFDHVASMLTQLQDREYGLNHTHSAFLSISSLSASRFQRRVIITLIWACMIINIVFFCTLYCTSFSMNVQIPADSALCEGDDGSIGDCTHTPFAGIASSLVVFPTILIAVYRVIMRRSEARSKRKMASR